MNRDKNYLLSSVSKALDILDLLSRFENLGVSEISEKTKINKASTFKLLYTLEKKGYIYKTSNLKYKLGIKFAHYGSIVLENQNIFTLIKPYLQKLRDKHNETTHLGILDDDFNVIFMVKESSNSTIQMTSKIGHKLPFYVTSMGKVLMASKLNNEIKEKLKNYKLKKYTENTITDYDDLIKVLLDVNEKGFAVDIEESEEGLVCFAVPIKDLKGETIAAISISGPSIRMRNNRNSLINSLKETSVEVSKALGYKEKNNNKIDKK
ncbi:MAG: IclR family transcriptional regulator [Tissierellales bacterium]|nr:IclR family transcriptional regulator [Tissierellales bacterium]